MTERRWFWPGVFLILLATAALRLHLLQTPLERDEGEYAYAGQLMLRGIPPYLYAANMKLPGTYAAYALVMAIFGQTSAGIHLGLLAVNAIAIVLIALIGRRLSGPASGIAAAAAYALMSFGFRVLGTQAHATHFVIAAALGGFVLLLRYKDSPRIATLVGSGLLFGLSFLMKQQGIFFCLCGLLGLCTVEWRKRRWLSSPIIFGLAMATPFALTCLLLWHAGVFPKFWFWTFTYAQAYATETSLGLGLKNLWHNLFRIFRENAAIWILGVAGLTLLWRNQKDKQTALSITAFLIFSFLAICPGLYFRPHYFILLLPAVALAAGTVVRRRTSTGIFILALLISLIAQHRYLFGTTPEALSKWMYGPELFIEAVPVSDYIRNHSTSDTRIAVLGSEPEIYFYSNRLSATSYLYTYGLMENQPYAATMQEEMIQEITQSQPEFIVEVNGNSSWDRHDYSPTQIFTWWETYRTQHYTRVGVAARNSQGQSVYQWSTEPAVADPRANSLAVYRRR